MLYDSIQKLVKLPDDTIVYPAHGAGSLCGKQLSKETSSTMGQQKRYNYALQPMSRDDFIKLVTADQPDAPDYFVHDAITNRRERPALDESLKQALRPLPLDDLPPVCGKATARCSTSAKPSTSKAPTSKGLSTSASRASTPPGAAPCSATTSPSS